MSQFNHLSGNTPAPVSNSFPVTHAHSTDNVVDFYLGGHTNLTYPMERTPGEMFEVVFDHEVKLNDDTLREYFLSRFEYNLASLRAPINEGTLKLDTCYFFDQISHEVLVGVWRSLPVLDQNTVCFSEQLGNFIVLSIDPAFHHGTQYATIICLEPTYRFEYHSLQRIVIPRLLLHERVRAQTIPHKPFRDRWARVDESGSLDLLLLSGEKRIKLA